MLISISKDIFHTIWGHYLGKAKIEHRTKVIYDIKDGSDPIRNKLQVITEWSIVESNLLVLIEIQTELHRAVNQWEFEYFTASFNDLNHLKLFLSSSLADNSKD